MAELLLYLVPRKYSSLGHYIVGFGGFIIIFLGIIFSYRAYLIVLGHCCLLIGLSGTYFRKIRVFRSARKSEEKGEEKKEEKGVPGINSTFLVQKYALYAIILVGIICILIFEIPLQWRLIQRGMDYDGLLHLEGLLAGIAYRYLLGYLLLIGGLFLLYFKQRKSYRYWVADIPERYRLSKRLKCNDCGVKFTSKILECPDCKGKDILLR